EAVFAGTEDEEEESRLASRSSLESDCSARSCLDRLSSGSKLPVETKNSWSTQCNPVNLHRFCPEIRTRRSAVKYSAVNSNSSLSGEFIRGANLLADEVQRCDGRFEG